jgi:hypothetical protein
MWWKAFFIPTETARRGIMIDAPSLDMNGFNDSSFLMFCPFSFSDLHSSSGGMEIPLNLTDPNACHKGTADH